MSQNRKIAQGLGWKILERFGVLGGQFVLQIVLARMLDPEHYGVLSLMVIFTSLANVFIQQGFNTALIQNKEVTDEDYSSVFWVNLCIVSVIYVAFFFAAPVIAVFYEMPDIVWPFRVLCLMLFPGALNSVQLARLRKKMDFKKVFLCNVAGILFSGTLGIALAYFGAGLWALVAQNVLNVVVVSIVMWFTVDFRPRWVFNLSRIKVLFSFGWKLTVSGLLDTFYQDIRSLVIGVKYDADMLGYYDRGKQFPQFLNSAINSAVQSVMLPAMSAEQDDIAKVKTLMRNSILLSSYIVFPMMAGLAAVATPLVRLMLTDKWLPCVPYMQIYCFNLAFYPVHSCNLQAINAMGRSDIFLKLEVIKKLMGIVLLSIAVICFDSPIAIAMTGAFSTIINCFVNSYPNKKLIGYSYFEQMADILPAWLLSIGMMVCVMAVEQIHMGVFATLVTQIAVGIVIYISASAILRFEQFEMIISVMKKIMKRK